MPPTLCIATEEDEDEDAPVITERAALPTLWVTPMRCHRLNCKSGTHSCCRKAGRSAYRYGERGVQAALHLCSPGEQSPPIACRTLLSTRRAYRRRPPAPGPTKI
eukprot:scaffold29647_cov145-Isochrysis_galbana.AAC.12